MEFVIQLVLSALAVIIAAYIIPGIHVKNFVNALIVAIVLSLLNVFVEPIMVWLTIPITIVTFGLFLLVINALIIMLAGAIVPGFKVDGFWWALIFSILLSIVTYLLEQFTFTELFNMS